ncbi:hypothetical protein [Ralstonia solanacearum]|uniref:hypothetical protein n=1 Tax=Ralstonia solanacearum TaxID=305 RepID=UPI00399D5947
MKDKEVIKLTGTFLHACLAPIRKVSRRPIFHISLMLFLDVRKCLSVLAPGRAITTARWTFILDFPDSFSKYKNYPNEIAKSLIRERSSSSCRRSRNWGWLKADPRTCGGRGTINGKPLAQRHIPA